MSTIERALCEMRKTGRADLSRQPFVDLSELSSSRVMRELDLSHVQIESIAGLPFQPNLRTFIANGSSILSLRNFGAIPNVESVSLRDTPVSRDPNFVTALLIICPNIAIVNGRMVSSRIKERAARYPDVVVRLVDAGWMPTYPCPDDSELKEACEEFEVEWAYEEEEELVEDLSDHDDDFEESLNSFYAEQQKIVSAARRFCGLEVAEEEEDTGNSPSSPSSHASESDPEEEPEPVVRHVDKQPLLSKIAKVLTDSGIEVKEEEMQSSVMKIIDTLCVQREKAQGQSDV